MNSEDIEKLKILGLTKQEIKVYSSLQNCGVLNAKELASRIHILPHTAYRTLNSLEKKRMIQILPTYPLSFQAFSPAIAYRNIADDQIRRIKEINDIFACQTNVTSKKDQTHIDFVADKDRIYNLGAKLLQNTKEEMLVISIGESIPQDLLYEVVKAKEHNVIIRMIIQKYDESNKDIIENFKKNGYEIRYCSDWGYHLAIYDSKKTLLILNNPEDTEQRTAVSIQSKGMSTALRNYFYSVWEKAQVV